MALISPYANKKKHNKQLNQHLNELAEFLRFTIEIRPNEFLFASSLLSHIFRSTTCDRRTRKCGGFTSTEFTTIWGVVYQTHILNYEQKSQFQVPTVVQFQFSSSFLVLPSLRCRFPTFNGLFSPGFFSLSHSFFLN